MSREITEFRVRRFRRTSNPESLIIILSCVASGVYNGYDNDFLLLFLNTIDNGIVFDQQLAVTPMCVSAYFSFRTAIWQLF